MQPTEKKTLSEKEAWSWLAEQWEMCPGGTHSVGSGQAWAILLYGDYYQGLCPCVEDLLIGLRFPVRIDRTTRDVMMSKIHAVGPATFKWPRTSDGAKQRAAFCRLQASFLQSEEDKICEEQVPEKAPDKSPEASELSEKEAWYWLAEKWQDPVYHIIDPPKIYIDSSYYATCLCDSVKYLAAFPGLYGKPWVSDTTRESMLKKIAVLPRDYGEIFVWPRTLEGAKQRAAFCLAEAKKLEPPEYYKEWIVALPTRTYREGKTAKEGGKFGFSWKRASEPMSEEQARKEAPRVSYANPVAIPKKLFDDFKAMEALKMEAENLLDNLRAELRRIKETHDSLVDNLLRGAHFSEAMKEKLDSCLRNLDDHYNHTKKG